MIKAVEIRALHDGIQHGLEDEDGVFCYLVLSDIHTEEGLEKPNHDDDQEGEKYQ